MGRTKGFFRGAIVLNFAIGLEILIMISPAAGFFYAAFNPILLSLAGSPATRWLTAFFLPHLVLPPDPLLKAVRAGGSVLFVAGATVFFVCAGQVYSRKFAGRGVALRGLYSRIRHPQYLGLATTGLGLSILWPRFLLVALWIVMVVLYFLLARDEERRMLGKFGADYRPYMDRSGMFLPKGLEDALGKLLPPGGPSRRAAVALLLLAGCALGGAFALRAHAVGALPLRSAGPVTALAVLPGDLEMLDHRLAPILEMPEVKARLEKRPGPFLVYVMPVDYVMQGLIADTGAAWRLYKRRHTLSMIADWILHPFRHLEDGHAAMHGGRGPETGRTDGRRAGVRRMIFLAVETQGGRPDRRDLFGIGATRRPLFMADVDAHRLVLEGVRDLPSETGWGRVPTPVF